MSAVIAFLFSLILAIFCGVAVDQGKMGFAAGLALSSLSVSILAGALTIGEMVKKEP